MLRVSRGTGIDVTAPDAADRIAAAAPGPVDILVNNAGTSFARSIEDLTDDDWNGLWELHVLASMRLMRAFAPGMGERGWWRIVNVGSSAGKRPSLTNAAYSVTKAAQHSLSRAFANAYAPQGVLINTVTPGRSPRPWTADGGRPTRRPRRRASARAGGPRRPGRQGAARPLRGAGGDRERGRVPVLAARLDRDRRGLSVDGGTFDAIV